MLSSTRARAALAYAGFSLLCFAALDAGIGSFAHAASGRSFRIEHPYYHHGLRPHTSTETTWGGRRYQMRTDSLGFRDAEDRTIAPHPSGRRVVVIGDSMLEGLGVAYADTAAGLLAERGRARGVEVLNAAVVSYSPKLYDLRTRWLVTHDRLELQRLVVFVDISDTHDEVLYEGFVPHEDPAGLRAAAAWWRAHSLVSQLLDRFVFARSAIDNRFRKDADVDVWMKSVDAYRKPVGNPDAGRWEWTYDDAAYEAWGRHGLALADAHMAALAAFCRERGIELAVAVYPSPYQIFANEREGRQVVFWRTFCERERLPFVDLFPLFVDPAQRTADATYDRYFLPGDVHWNEAGHALVADRVEEVVLGDAR
jgi:lysophospholipase L1-like esterase